MKTRSITKVTLLSILVMSVITAVTLNSCQKESIKPRIVNGTAKSTNGSGFSASSNLIIAETNKFIFGTGKGEKGLIPDGVDSSSCAVVTADTVTKPYSLTYNYGSGCVGSDGKTRSGIVRFTYSDKDIRVVNNSVSLTFQNYTVDSSTLNGSISITNNGPNGSGNHIIAENGAFISISPSQTDTMNIDYQLEWLAGEFSSPAANWQFGIDGSIHGASSTGNSVSIVITSTVIRNAKTNGCNFFIQGTEQMAVSGQPTEYIDFGNPGGCSGMKSETVNGVTTVVSQDAD